MCDADHHLLLLDRPARKHIGLSPRVTPVPGLPFLSKFCRVRWCALRRPLPIVLVDLVRSAVAVLPGRSICIFRMRILRNGLTTTRSRSSCRCRMLRGSRCFISVSFNAATELRYIEKFAFHQSSLKMSIVPKVSMSSARTFATCWAFRTHLRS
jgi:hypothetical protein